MNNNDEILYVPDNNKIERILNILKHMPGFKEAIRAIEEEENELANYKTQWDNLPKSFKKTTFEIWMNTQKQEKEEKKRWR